VRLKAGWGERGAGRFTHALLLFYVGDGGLVAENQLEGEVWCRSDDELLAWRRARYTRSTLIYVGVGRTSVALSALHTCNLVEGP
jgi:hypothetical protein